MIKSHFLSAGATASRNSEKAIYETSKLASKMYLMDHVRILGIDLEPVSIRGLSGESLHVQIYF